MTRIWLVSELYYPEESSTGFYITKIAEGLADRFDVHVLCGQPTYSRRGIRAPRKEIHKGVSIKRCASTTLDKNVITYRLLNIVTLGISIFLHALIDVKQGDEVMVVTTPPSMPFVVGFACLLKRAKYLLLIHDNYPEILIAAGMQGPDSLFVRIMNWLNKKLYKHASVIVVVGRDMKELVSRKRDGDASHIVTIPNWAELESVNPTSREQNELLLELGLEDKFVLLYAGNMGYPNDLETIVSSARQLRKRKEFHFLFIGSGIKYRWLDETVKKEGLRNVTVLPARRRSDQTLFLNACDVAVISFVDKMLGVSMPSRTYNTLASGKPMIGVVDARSELAIVINEEKVGWVVPPHEPELLTQAIIDAESDRRRLIEMGGRARSAAEKKYSLEKAIEDYFAVFSATEVTEQVATARKAANAP